MGVRIMPEFNNINYELTNGEKFALICGMLVGLRLQDKTQPPDQVTVTLDPIGVNGLGTIGLMAEDVKYTGVNSISIPVITHDVDIDYSGFSLLVSYNNSRIVINSITEGDFGTLQGTNIQNGRAYTRCMLDPGKFKNEPCIVCWLNCTIVSPPTSNNPIEIKFENSNGYDPNYCSLLTWVKNDTDEQYYSYFITPTLNKGCKITSDKLPDNVSNLGDETQTSAVASPSLIAMGTTIIHPGTQGLVPIYTNCNLNDDFVYNGFILRAIIPVEWLDILSEINIESTGEWTISYTEEYDTAGNLVLNITGSRAEAKADNSTVGFIRFFLSATATNLGCIIENNYSELTGPSGALGVVKGDGYVYYSPSIGGGGGGIPSGGGSTGWGSGGGAGGGSGGGTYGHGTIWSGSSQDIWVDMGDGNKYPIHLEPGNNDVYIFIPSIYPEDLWIETTPKIEAPGYILIPGGFTWETVIKPEAPLELSSPRITERFELKDLYDVEKVTPIIPTDIDNIIDEYTIEDIQNMTLQEIAITFKDLIEEFESQDVFDIVMEHAPTTFYEEQLDEVEVEDVNNNTLINLIISDETNEESIGVDDVYDVDIEYAPYSGGTDEIIDNINSTDVQSNDIVNTTITNKDNVDTINAEDICDID
jgi:hypothetical protein